MKIYLAGPMRGYPEFNFPAFDKETARLRALGHDVFSPAERDRNDGLIPGKTEEEMASQFKGMAYYMAIDLPEVCKADAIVVLPGWECSQGANIEVAVGREVGKQILHAGSLLPVQFGMPFIEKAARQLFATEDPIYCPQFSIVSGSLTPPPKSVPLPNARIPSPLEKPDTTLGEYNDNSNPKDLLGMKKPPLRLVPPASIIYLSKVMALGAKKYGPYNWRDKRIRHSVYLEAAMRHILSAQDGETADPESGLPHEAHAMACMAILLDALSLNILLPDLPPPGAAAKLITEFTEKH